jgi:hypothetical protein
MRFLFILSIMFVGIGARAGTIDPSTSDHRHLEYGSKFKNVVRITGLCSCGKNHNFYASAVIIKPNWALTAAHVVKGTSNVQILVGDKKFDVKTKHHKEFEENNFGNNDIAICYSKENFNMDFYPELYQEKDEVGKIISIAGYGLHGTFSTGAISSDGKKRAGSNIINRSENSILICSLDDKKTQLEFLIAHGDSGGGLFIGNKLAGINSFVMAKDKNPDSSYGDESGHTRISIYYDWIVEQMKQTID